MLHVERLSKSYAGPHGTLEILGDLDLELQSGQAAVIMGPSGSGKSTLLNIVGGLEPPTAGSVALDDMDPYALADRDLARFRNERVGFVFQEHHLLPQCNVLENVLIPTLPAPRDPATLQRARDLIERVGLTERIMQRPATLSGGERQRVAIARALIRDPQLLLADEPTGSLDQRTAEQIVALLLEVHRERQGILICVTHSLALAERFPSRYALREGKLIESVPMTSE